jgi:hypothetical protein
MTKKNETSNSLIDPPTLYEVQLFPGLNPDPGCRTIDISEPNMYAFEGPRGGMKTMSLSYFAIIAMASGLNVWLNYPLEFYLVKRGGKTEHMKAELLDLHKLLTFSPEYKHGFIGLDEYQDICSAYSFNSTKNRLLDAFIAQIRKNELSFGYTSKKRNWVDTRTRDELDIAIRCMDASKTPSGWNEYKKGEMAYWEIYDVSGIWTGYEYDIYQTTFPYKLYARPIWGCYNTKFTIDIFDSMRGVHLDLEKTQISDKAQDEINWEAMLSKTAELFIQQEKWTPADLWDALGIYSPNDKRMATKVLEQAGYRPGAAMGRRYYRSPTPVA